MNRRSFLALLPALATVKSLPGVVLFSGSPENLEPFRPAPAVLDCGADLARAWPVHSVPISRIWYRGESGPRVLYTFVRTMSPNAGIPFHVDLAASHPSRVLCDAMLRQRAGISEDL